MKRTILLWALCAAVAAAGCGCSSSGSSGKDHSGKKNKTAVREEVTESETADDSESGEKNESTPTAKDGPYIKKLYDLMNSGEYSIKEKYTDSKGRVTYITQIVRGSDCIIRQENELGENGFISVGGESYDYDLLCGVYRKSRKEMPLSLVQYAVEQELPQSASRIDEDLAEVYAAEEYTFVGDTYITVLDFYFERETGLPVEYTVTYSVEGQDNVTELREFLEIVPGSAFITEEVPEDIPGDSSSEEASDSSEADIRESGAETESSADESETRDESSSGTETALEELPQPAATGETIDETALDLGFLEQLADFDVMTEERRLGYCQAIFVTAGISQNELSYIGMTDDKLRTISYDEFTELVYSLKEEPA